MKFSTDWWLGTHVEATSFVRAGKQNRTSRSAICQTRLEIRTVIILDVYRQPSEEETNVGKKGAPGISFSWKAIGSFLLPGSSNSWSEHSQTKPDQQFSYKLETRLRWEKRKIETREISLEHNFVLQDRMNSKSRVIGISEDSVPGMA